MAKNVRKIQNTGVTPKEAEKLENAMRDVLAIPDDTSVLISLKKQKIPIPDYVMLFKKAAELMVSSIGDIHPSVYKVWFFFLSQMEYGNYIPMHQETICEKTNLNKRTVIRAVSTLVNMNVIIKAQDLQDKRTRLYVVNPHIAWRGTAKQRVTQIRKTDKNQLAIPFATDEQQQEISRYC